MILNEYKSENRKAVSSPGQVLGSSKAIRPVQEKIKKVASSDFSVLLEKTGFIPHRGILKGFIDMVFEYKERFYIIDWKTNHLGNSISDYSHPALMKTMNENYYILQYHIYAVGLNRLLMNRMPGYDYDQHFGGIFYLFVRGIEPAEPLSGVFYDRPSKDTIDSIDEYLIAENAGAVQ